jgi:hypothetical protein
VSTASKTSRLIPLEALAADIERRRAETGIAELPRNSGERRTASKRALLTAIEAAGGQW